MLSESCKRLLTIINPPIPALLIDSDILMQIANGNCEKAEKSVKVGVTVYIIFVTMILKIGVDEKLKTRGFGVDGQFDSVFFRNSSDKDYLEFRTYPKTIIPKWVITVVLIHLILYFLEISLTKSLEIGKFPPKSCNFWNFKKDRNSLAARISL